MNRKSTHHMLPPTEQEKLAKERIEELLKEHNLGENVDLIYLIICECCKVNVSNEIDLCIDKIVKEFEGEKKVFEDADDERKNKQYYDVYSKT